MKVNIIFPMAGEGRRFGYKFKPFIFLNDMKFIQHAFHYFDLHLRECIDIVYFVITKEQEELYNVESHLKEMFECYNIDVIILPRKTKGPFETIKTAITIRDIKCPLFICDCDHQIDIEPFLNIIKKKDTTLDCVVSIFEIEESDMQNWGKVYIKNNEIYAFSEKDRLEFNNESVKLYGLVGCHFLNNLRIFETDDFENISEAFEKYKRSLKFNHVTITNALFFGTQDKLNDIIKQRRKKMSIFCDIDGTLFKHQTSDILHNSSELLQKLHQENHKIILTTARQDEKRLKHILYENSIPFDDLICNLNSGPRYLVNDLKPDIPLIPQAYSVNIFRNEGILSINPRFNDVEVVQYFQGGSFSKTVLVKCCNDLFIRKYILKKENIKQVEFLKQQYICMKKYAKMNEDMFPNIYTDFENDYMYSYDMQYLESYKTLDNFEFDFNISKMIVNHLEATMYSVRRRNVENWLEIFINSKLKSICSNFNVQNILNFENLYINDQYCDGFYHILNKLNYREFEPIKLCIVHGDLTFENILYNDHNKSLKFIDLDCSEVISAPELDLGKLLQSLISNYESWSKVEDIHITMEDTSIKCDIYNDITNIDSKFRLLENWKDILEIDSLHQLKRVGIFYMIIHLFRMIPYRLRKSEKQAMYAAKECVYWMNYLYSI